jgi:hypothetical protein
MARPSNARPALTRTWVHSSPDAASVHPARATSTGAGSTRVDSQPNDDAACQATSSASGTSQGSRRWPVARAAAEPTGQGAQGTVPMAPLSR